MRIRSGCPGENANGSSSTGNRPVGTKRLGPFARIILKVMVRIDNAAGAIKAANAPCNARAPNNMAWSLASPPRAEALGEPDEPDHEHPPPAPEVGHPTTQEQEPSEGQVYAVMTHCRLATEI